MLKKIFNTSNRNQMKKNAIYILLLISNIALFIGLFNYYSHFAMNMNLNAIDEISAIIATIIILGFISVKLPNIKNLGNHPLYGIGGLILICAVGFITSYYSSKLNMPVILDQYLEMFKYLSGVLIFVLIAITLKPFKEILLGKHTRKNQIICLIIFTFIGLFASYAHFTINNTPANIRCLIVMIGGLIGGPIVGIPVGIISGIYRYTIGGTTALPCAISTIISGIISSLIFLWNDKKFPNFFESLILMGLFTGFEMLMVVIMTPPDISFPFIKDIYPIMLFASLVGMLLFSIVVKEERANMNPEPNEAEKKISKIESKLESHDAENEKLKNEIEDLKNEIEELKNSKNQ